MPELKHIFEDFPEPGLESSCKYLKSEILQSVLQTYLPKESNCAHLCTSYHSDTSNNSKIINAKRTIITENRELLSASFHEGKR